MVTNQFSTSKIMAYSGFLFGVLLLLINPDSAEAFQSDSLSITQNLKALRYSAVRFGDYDNDGDLDLIIGGEASNGRNTILYMNNGSGSFTSADSTTFTAVDYPAFAWGDIDGDGDLDLAMAGQIASSVYTAKIYRNDGSGVFTEISDPLTDSYWGDLEWGDLDNDGDLDLIQNGYPANGVRFTDIFWNDGKGNLTKDINNSFTGTAAGDLVLADVDNDGDLDLINNGFTNYSTGLTELLLNDGTGNFSLKQTLDDVAGSGMDWGDFDNDGDLDLILSGYDFTNSVRVTKIYLNDGTGSLSYDSGNAFSYPANESKAKWGDYDHDGDLDILITGIQDTYGYKTWVYENNGAGSIGGIAIGDGVEIGSIDWADLDNDGFLDFVITGSTTGGTRMSKVYTNTRTSSYATPTTPSNIYATISSDSISFNWDASTVTDGGPLTYSMYYQSADSTRFVIPSFADTTTGKRTVPGLGSIGLTRTHTIAKSNIPTGNFSWGIQALDGGGTTSSFATQTLQIPTATNGDSLQISQVFQGLQHSTLEFADYDNDDDLDVLIAGDNGTSFITLLYKNDGSGIYSPDASNSLTGFSYPAAAFGDMDNDGDLDLAISGNTSGGYAAKIYENNGSGVFSEVSDPLNDAYWGDLEWGDLDNDGDLDLVQNGYPSSGNRVTDIFWNDGDGNLTKDTNNSFTGSADGDLVLADYDNDGDLDLINNGYIDAGGAITELHTNDGTGNFTLKQTLTGIASSGIDWGDYNNDGDLDLIISGYDYTNSVRVTNVYQNDGNGTLVYDAANAFSYPVSHSKVKWGDYDHDGDLDVILTGNTTAFGFGTFIYANNGSGVLGGVSTSINTGVEIGGLAWVDVDNDGYLDVAITGNSPGGKISRIYKNSRSTSNASPGAPTGITHSVNGDTLEFTWNGASDTEGGPLGYSVYLINTDSNTTVIPALSNTSTGVKKLIHVENSWISTSHKIQLSSLDLGNYTFGVQTVDGSGRTSLFTTYTDFTYEGDNESIGLTVSSTSLFPGRVDWLDIDNDGDLDLVEFKDDGWLFGSNSTTRYDDRRYSVKVRYNDGNGNIDNTATTLTTLAIEPTTFKYYTDDLVENTPVNFNEDIAYADVDGDSELDIVACGMPYPGGYNANKYRVIYGNSGGAFPSMFSAFSLGLGSCDNVSVQDIDKDGDLDFLMLGYQKGSSLTSLDVTDHTVMIIDNGSGYVTQSTNIEGMLLGDTFWFDYEKDGDPDVLVNGLKPYLDGGNVKVDTTVQLYLNNGYGTFSASGNLSSMNLFLYVGGYSSAYSRDVIKEIDFEEDGDLDLIYIDKDGIVRALVWGSGSYAQNTTIESEFSGTDYNSIEVVDFDSDGNADVLLTSSVDDAEIYLGDGTGGFTKSSESFAGTFYENDIAVADYDNDGDPDLVVFGKSVSGYAMTVSLFKNNSANRTPVPSAPTNMKAAFLSSSLIRFTWDAPSNKNGNVFYNFYAKNNSSGETYPKVIGASSDGVFTMHNSDYGTTNTFYDFDTSGLPSGYYSFYVQAVNEALRYSDRTESIFIDLPVGVDIQLSSETQSFSSPGVASLQNVLVQNGDFMFDSTLTISAPDAAGQYLFIDANNSNDFDTGDTKVTNSGVSYTPSVDSLRYKTTGEGIKELTATVASVLSSGTSDLSFVGHIDSTQINGTANEGGWYLLTNPFNSTLGTFLSDIWTQGAINGDSESGTPNIYVFNPDSADYVAITTDLDTTTVSAGEGILVYVFPDDNYNDEVDPVDGGWPKTISNSGNPFGESISVAIKNTDVDGNEVTSGSEGFMLMGNPYGFAVDVDSIIAKMVSIDPYANRYVYRWDAVNKQYNLNFTGSVNAYESFFVRTIQSGTSGNVSFDYDDAHSSANLKSRPLKYPITLTLHSGEASAGSYYVRLGEEAEKGIDPLDGYYLGSFASEFSNLYSTIGDQPLALNNIPLDLSRELEIPLFLHTSEKGAFSLEWTLSQLPENWKVELEDPSTGSVVDLREEGSYDFEYSNKQKKNPVSELSTDGLFEFQKNTFKGKEKSEVKSDLILRINSGIVNGLENDLGIPTEVELYQNYPNPFNPSSVIRFGVPNTAKVHLEVFDVLGRKVATLLDNETKNPGRYNLKFDARDLASGIYIYRLVIGDKVLTKKMTLIK